MSGASRRPEAPNPPLRRLRGPRGASTVAQRGASAACECALLARAPLRQPWLCLCLFSLVGGPGVDGFGGWA